MPAASPPIIALGFADGPRVRSRVQVLVAALASRGVAPVVTSMTELFAHPSDAVVTDLLLRPIDDGMLFELRRYVRDRLVHITELPVQAEAIARLADGVADMTFAAQRRRQLQKLAG